MCYINKQSFRSSQGWRLTACELDASSECLCCVPKTRYANRKRVQVKGEYFYFYLFYLILATKRVTERTQDRVCVCVRVFALPQLLPLPLPLPLPLLLIPMHSPFPLSFHSLMTTQTFHTVVTGRKLAIRPFYS